MVQEEPAAFCGIFVEQLKEAEIRRLMGGQSFSSRPNIERKMVGRSSRLTKKNEERDISELSRR